MVCLGVDTDRSSACLFGITIWRQDYMMVLVLSSPPLPIPLWVQYIPAMLHFTLLVYAVTAAHHYGTAWANFNGCHRQQEKMQACQRKQRTEAKKDGLLCGGWNVQGGNKVEAFLRFVYPFKCVTETATSKPASHSFEASIFHTCASDKMLSLSHLL